MNQIVRELNVMDPTGHTKLTWDSDVDVEVSAARSMFDTLIGKGYSAFRVEDGEQGRRIKTFDPDAEEILMMPQLVGG